MTALLPAPAPPADVLAAFGARGTPQPLTGGQGTSWRVGALVLKPSAPPEAVAAWQAGLLHRLDGRAAVRVSLPVPTVDGFWTSQGWTAARFAPGEHRPGRWREVVDAGRDLHRALADEPRPAWLATRADRWAVADRVAWGERRLDVATPPHVARLLAALRPVAAPSQLVHGDLSGNVLFADGLPPLVLDLSLYWRPVGWAASVVVADALVAGDVADAEPAQALATDPDGPQHLLRAVLFRAVTAALAGDDDAARTADASAAATDVALRLAAG